MKNIASILLLLTSFFPLLCAQSHPADDITMVLPNGNIRDGFFISPNIFLRRCDTYYIIDYCPPQFNIVADDSFEFLDYPDSIFEANLGIDMLVQHLFDPGYPELPFYSLSLQFPAGSTLQQIVMVPMNECDTSNILPWDELLETLDEGVHPEYIYSTSLSGIYKPAQLCFGNYICPFQYEESYYNGSDESWNQTYNIYNVDSIGYKKTHGINFSIFPLQYHPLNRELWVLQPTRFYIKYTCLDPFGECNLINVLNQYVEDFDATQFYDSYTTDEKELSYPYFQRGDYLIITEDCYISSPSLSDFIQHKEDLGYTMHVESFPSINNDDGVRINSIKNKIRQHFQNDTDLRYVLFVGSETALPPSAGLVLNMPNYSGYSALFESQAEIPPTDIYYECFDANSDSKLFPKVVSGRWLVYGENDLNNVVRKTIHEEFQTNDYSLALFAGIDSSSYYNTRFYENDCRKVKQLMLNAGACVAEYEGDNFLSEVEAKATFIETLTQGNYWMLLYRGHGSVISLGDPYNIYASTLSNSGAFCPFGIGFSCLTNSYYHYAFARSSICNDYGFCAYYGASAYSYSYPNRDNMKLMYQLLSQNPTKNYSIGNLINIVEQKYFSPKKNNSYAQQHIKTYYLAGDPSMYIYGLYGTTGESLSSTSPMQHRRYQYNQDDMEDNIVYIYDILGRIKYKTGDKNILTNGDSELYLMITFNNRGEIIEKKKIVNLKK